MVLVKRGSTRRGWSGPRRRRATRRRRKRKWWAQLHKERIEESDVREKFLQVGITEEQLRAMGQAMLDWADDMDGVLAFIQYGVDCPT
jgi:hypothetical protein